MTIGGSIVLFIFGAILTFAVTADVQGINLDAVGVIMMIGGAVGFVVGLVLMQRSRVVERRIDDPDAY